MGLSSVTLLGMSASESTSGGFGGLHQSILGRTNLCPVSIVDLDVVVVVVVPPPPRGHNYALPSGAKLWAQLSCWVRNVSSCVFLTPKVQLGREASES